MLWPCILLACTPTEPDAAPALIGLDVSVPSPDAPLVRRVVVALDRTAPLSITAVADGHVLSFDLASSEVHDRLLLGFRPDQVYDLTITTPSISDPLGGSEIVTDPLPDHFPMVDLVADPVRGPSDPTLISLRTARPVSWTPSELAVVFDAEGEVIWWMATPTLVQDVRTFEDGLLVLMGSSDPWFGIFGWDGIERSRYVLGPAPDSAIGVPTDGGGNVHHDVVPFADGQGFVALGRHGLEVDDWPLSYDDAELRGPATVAGDYVVEMGRDGAVLTQTAIADLIPVDRIGFDSLGTTVEGWGDWAHANAVVPDGDQTVVSLRHQDAIVAFVPGDAPEVSWILGNPHGWPADLEARRLTPVGDLQWPWHPHAPMFGPDLPDGRRSLVVFDNGNHRAAPFSGVDPVDDPAALSSRVVAYHIDEEDRTVSEAWSLTALAGGPVYSEAVGDADWLADGQILSTWGFLDRLPGGQSNVAAGLGERSVRIVEFDPSDGAEVWHLYLRALASDNVGGWSSYRAERIAPISVATPTMSR